MAKTLMWRMQGIKAGATKEAVLGYFEESERDRVQVKTLCPSVDNPHRTLTATFKYRHEPTSLDHIPGLLDRVRHRLSIDRDFFGFTPLHSPAAVTHDVDIIAVTGLAGHAIGSWSLQDGQMWLRDFLPHATQTARIMTYGYATKLQGPDLSIATMRDLAEAFRSKLLHMRKRTAQGDQRPVVFVGHSLGGLIIKLALIQAEESRIGPRLPVRLIVFFATPHRGMNIDALRTVIKNEPPQRLIDELEPNSGILRDLHSRFRRVSDDIQILSVYELQKTATVVYNDATGQLTRGGESVVLVTYESAVESRQNETSLPADANHSTIAKLSEYSESIYPEVRDMIVHSLLSEANTEDALNHDEKHHLAALIDGESSDQRTTSRTPQPVDSPVAAPSHVLSVSGQDRENMNTETQGATSIVESPNNEFNNRSALAFTDLRISEETEENAEIEAVPAGSATMSTTLDVDLEKSSFKALCRSCRAEITLSHPFYTCIPYSISHPSKHPGGSYDVCLTCQASVKTCLVHKRVLHRIDVVWHNGKPFDQFHINRGEEPGDSALVAALKARDLDRLNRLAKIPGLMDASDVNGHAPLHIAATLGFEAEVRCLIKNGADLETKNVQSQTPLFNAIGAQELSIAILLIESGANKAAIDGFLMSPLHFACSLSLTEAVAMLLSTEPAENIGTYADQTPDNGDSALLLACENGNFAIVRALLEAGADPNLMARNESGHLRPGSHRLPESQQGLEILRLLAEFGADFWRKDTSGWTQLHMNAFSGRADLCRELFNISTNSDQLKSSRSAAADVGNRAAHWDTLKTQLNADPNAITNNGYTALFLGASNGHADVCRTLLEFGANPSITAKPRRPTFPGSFSGIHTPLTSASYHGHEGVVSALISFGASVGPILGGTSPLLEATRGGYLKICEKLITAGADMNWCHGDQTALSNAAEYGRVRIVHMLFKKGARAWPLKNNGYRKKLFFEPGVDQQSRYRIAQAFKAQKLVYTRSAKTPIS